MKTIQVRNGELFYDEAGSGPPLLFLHAGVADSCMWQEQVDHFSKRYRAITCDLRGYGLSRLPDALGID